MRISDWSSDVCSSDLIKASDHVIFNSPAQIARFRPQIDAARRMGKAFDIGLRINPAHREGEVEKYDPLQSHRRLAHPISKLHASDLECVSGMHLHQLCAQDFLPVDRIWAAE